MQIEKKNKLAVSEAFFHNQNQVNLMLETGFLFYLTYEKLFVVSQRSLFFQKKFVVIS